MHKTVEKWLVENGKDNGYSLIGESSVKIGLIWAAIDSFSIRLNPSN